MEALNVCLREAFVETHRDFDVLGAFAESCLDVAVSGRMATLSDKAKDVDPLEIREKLLKTMPAPLDFGYLDLEQVLESEYFFS
jgi:DNA-directed RNA polymerase